jgi:hypothetical protein
MKHLKSFEDIKIPIKVGDTVLGGRFKNKKMVVKKIGKNKKGDITINDKPLLKFRLIKESLEVDIDDYFIHLEDDGFIIEKGEDFIRIFKPKFGDFYTATNLEKFNFSEISADVHRFVDHIESDSYPYSISNIIYIIESKDKHRFINPFERKSITISQISDLDFDLELLSLTIKVK